MVGWGWGGVPTLEYSVWTDYLAAKIKKAPQAVLFLYAKYAVVTDYNGTFFSISIPTLPAAISRNAVTPGLFLLSTLAVWPWLSMRARYDAANTNWKRLGICCRQSSTVIRAMNFSD
jgi:hypothetical protein